MSSAGQATPIADLPEAGLPESSRKRAWLGTREQWGASPFNQVMCVPLVWVVSGYPVGVGVTVIVQLLT